MVLVLCLTGQAGCHLLALAGLLRTFTVALGVDLASERTTTV